ncbi:hypothetical protein WA171_004607, partial [Blastocystis sp. BT1]
MKMDIISLLKQLELKYHCKYTSLPICSMEHIIAFRKDILPSESLSASDLLFRLRDVFRELDIISDSQMMLGERLFRLLVENNDRSCQNMKMVYLLLLLAKDSSCRVSRKRFTISPDLYLDDESTWFSRRSIACAKVVETTMNDQLNTEKMDFMIIPSSCPSLCITEKNPFSCVPAKKSYLPSLPPNISKY